ncbi:MAG: 23S rRNA (uracil(1939)-C(5))-methyltransferase RlmD [Ruminococcus sp.]|nr:23S rRNA (uracil(1939)-C(5))-methyltransferase RlmD [Ruminococcus sp.]
MNKTENYRKCKYFKRCGGCQLDMPYDKQIEWKQQKAERMLSRFTKVSPIITMDEPYNYRNKVQTVFKCIRKNELLSGVYQSSSGNMVAVDCCNLENIVSQKVVAVVKQLMKSFKIMPYDADTGKGTVRHILIKTGYYTKEIMLCIVTATPILTSKNQFVNAIIKKCPEITTIVHNICTNPMPLTLGNQENILYGKGYIEDIICGYRFRISSRSFYQVNPVQTEKLYTTAIKNAQLKDSDVLIDAYCGTGTIGILCSDHVKKVIGAELNKSACKDAVYNAKANNVTNIEFFNCDAGRFMDKYAKQGKRVDVVIMDPPRVGADRKFLESLLRLAPERVVYISCKIETLARDLKILTKSGYMAVSIQPVDMFPHTTGIETVVFLSR